MNIRIIDIPKIEMPEGNIGVIEKDTIPFDIKRIFYLYDVPNTAKRGGHAHKKLKQFLVALSGSLDVTVKDGVETRVVTLDRPDKGLLIECNIWGELENFSEGTVCMVAASEVYEEEEYIRDYRQFIEYVSK